MQRTLKNILYTTSLVCLISLISSCGGGGSSSGGSSSSGTSNSSNNYNYDTPILIKSSPANGETNTSVSQIIQIQFSEPVKNVTESTVSLYSGSANNPTFVEFSSINPGGNNSYTLTPKYQLNYSTTYYVSLSSNITSVDGNIPLVPTVFYFTTSTQVANPTVAMIHPLNNSEIESLNPVIKIQFSEAMKNVQGAVTLIESDPESGALVNITPLTQESNNIYSFKAIAPLSKYTKYYVNVGTDAVSVSTNKPVMPATFNFSISGFKFGYVTAGNGVTVCGVSESGIFNNCQLTYSSRHSYRTTINPAQTFGYIVSKNDDLVLVCNVNNISGLLTNCTSTGLDLHNPTGIAFTPSGKYAYVTNFSGNSLSMCNVNESTGALLNCTATGDITFSGPDAITVDAASTYAYVTNTNNNVVSKCTINNTTGVLSGCNKTVTGAFTTPKGAVLSSDNNYFYTTAIDRITGCGPLLLNGVTTCRDASTPRFTRLADLAINGSAMFVADSGNGAISFCQQTQSGAIQYCRFASFNNLDLTGITVVSY